MGYETWYKHKCDVCPQTETKNSNHIPYGWIRLHKTTNAIGYNYRNCKRDLYEFELSNGANVFCSLYCLKKHLTKRFEEIIDMSTKKIEGE